MYIDKLANIINKYNNTYHSAIKMRPVDVKSSAFIDLHKKNNKDQKFEVGDHVKNAEKCHVKNAVRWTYVICGLNDEEIVRRKKNCKKQIKENLEQKK